MTPLQPKDERLLALLLEQQQITPSQSARVRAQLGRGVEIHEALAKTPLVDALKLASIESMAASHAAASKEVKKPAPAAVAIPAPAPPANRVPVLDDADLDIELDQPASIQTGSGIYELRNLGPVSDPGDDFDDSHGSPALHELDEELELEPHHVSGEHKLDEELMMPDEDPVSDTKRDFSDFGDELDLPGKTPLPIKGPPPFKVDDIDFDLQPTMPKPEKRLNTNFDADLDAVIEHAMSGEHPIPIASEGEFTTLSPLSDKDSFRSPQKSMQVFSTADDEGINLIREVNEIFARVLDAEGAGFVIDPRRVEDNLIIYDPAGQISSQETIHRDRIDKVANRLKVMGRLEPWRRQNAQKGHFRIKHKSDNVDVYIQTQPKTADKEVLLVRVERW